MSRQRSAARRDGRDGASPSFTLATFLPYRLSVLSTLVSEALARRYSERFGIGVPEWRVLATIGEFRSITAKATGLHAHMNKVKVSRAAAALEARGLIRRRPNEEDLREAFLVLTPAGEDVYRRIIPLARDLSSWLTAELSVDEKAAFDATLGKLLLRAQEVD